MYAHVPVAGIAIACDVRTVAAFHDLLPSRMHADEGRVVDVDVCQLALKQIGQHGRCPLHGGVDKRMHCAAEFLQQSRESAMHWRMRCC
jgi:hypothetical protein